MSGIKLTVIFPNIQKKEALENFEVKKIEIHFEEPKAVVQDAVESSADGPTVATHHAVENQKNETVKGKRGEAKNEKKWPERNFRINLDWVALDYLFRCTRSQLSPLNDHPKMCSSYLAQIKENNLLLPPTKPF